MFKYTFYSMNIRKFEQEQLTNVEESRVVEEFLKFQLKTNNFKDENEVLKKLDLNQKKCFLKYHQLDCFIDEESMKRFEEKLNNK